MKFNWLLKAADSAATSPRSTSTSVNSFEEPDLDVCFVDEDAADSPFSNQPPTPRDIDFPTTAMPNSSSPIDIATTSRNSSSSPSSQGLGQHSKKATNYLDVDSRTSAMMSGSAYDSGMGRSRQESFGGAKPISMNNPNRNLDGRQRRESLANSLVQGMSWGGVSVGSWIRDEYVILSE